MWTFEKIRKERERLEAELKKILEAADPTDEQLTRAEEIGEKELPNLDRIQRTIVAADKRARDTGGAPDTADADTDDGVEGDEITAGEDRRALAPYSFGQYLLDVRTAALDRQISDRLAINEKNQLRALGLSESVPSDGGFLVGKDMLPDVFKPGFAGGEIASRVDRVQIGPNSNGIKRNAIAESIRANGSRWGGVVVYWANEGDTATKSKPKFRRVEMSLEKMIGLYYATDEELQDAVMLESLASRAFISEMQYELEDNIINGDGAAKPQGILNSAALVTVAKESGQANTTVVAKNISKMWSRMYAPSRRNAVWFINQDVEPELDGLNVPVGTGGMPVYLPAGGYSAAPFATLKGRPVVPVEQCATLGTAGDIILADLSQWMLIEKGGIQQASSAHVQFLTDEMTFRFTWRVNGQSMWDTAVTPAKGSNTISPFVALAARA